jgi:large subunit ribosomal protein L28
LKKSSVLGGKKIHRGISKKSGGIGLQLVKRHSRLFFPNLQKKSLRLGNGSIKKVWVSAKAIKKGFTVIKLKHI